MFCEIIGSFFIYLAWIAHKLSAATVAASILKENFAFLRSSIIIS